MVTCFDLTLTSGSYSENQKMTYTVRHPEENKANCWMSGSVIRNVHFNPESKLEIELTVSSRFSHKTTMGEVCRKVAKAIKEKGDTVCIESVTLSPSEIDYTIPEDQRDWTFKVDVKTSENSCCSRIFVALLGPNYPDIRKYNLAQT